MPFSDKIPAPARGGRCPPVLIASLLRGDGATGVETHSREVLDYLSHLGARGEAVTAFDLPPALRDPLFAPRRLLERTLPEASVGWYRWSHRVALTVALRGRLRGGSPAVIYAQCPVAAAAALQARSGPHQVVVLAVHFHGSQADEWVDRKVLSPEGAHYRRIRCFEERVIPAVDGHVYVSDSARTGLAAAVSGLEDVPWIHIPNFRGDTLLRPPSSAPTADLVTTGSLEPHKNHRYLLEVLAEAAREGHQYTLDVIGQGSLLAALTHEAEALGLKSAVRFLGRRENPRALLPDYRLYVHSSIRETGPLAVIEAMSVGLPVIAPSVGEVPKILGDGSCGAIWPLDDARAASKVLISVLGDRAGLGRMSRAARHRFLQSYSADQVAPRLIAFFEGIARAGAEAGQGQLPVGPRTAMPA